MLRIEQEWYQNLTAAESQYATATERATALKQLKEEILAVAPIFSQAPYFMNEEFSLVDCYVAPLLWRMQELGVEFTGVGSKAIKTYMTRVFERDSFVQSIGNASPKNLMDDK